MRSTIRRRKVVPAGKVACRNHPGVLAEDTVKALCHNCLGFEDLGKRTSDRAAGKPPPPPSPAPSYPSAARPPKILR